MTDLTQVLKACTQEIKAPLALSEAQYTEGFLEISDEIAKLQSISGEKPDYEIIISKAIEVLSEEAKHIKPICYLIFALYQLEKEAGLATGLEILAISLEQLGDEIYPNKKKKRARAASFEWLRKQLIEEIESKDLSNITFEQLTSIAESSTKIKEWMLEYCEDQATTFFSTFKAYQHVLEEKKQKQEAKEKELEQKAKQQAEQKEAEEKAKQVSEKTKDESKDKGDPIDLIEMPDFVDMGFDDEGIETDDAISQENIYPAFLNHIQNTHLPFDIDNLDADKFDLHRSLLWSESILELPKYIERIEDTAYPISHYQTAIKLYQEGQFEEALTAFEKLFFKVPFHFDIQYYQTQCLIKLLDRQQANKITLVIASRLKNVLKSNIDLLDQQYPDGPRCASPHVLKWLQNDILAINSSRSNKLLDAFIQNDAFGRPPVEQISERYRNSHSFKDKLNLQLNMALNLKEDGQDALALTILEKAYKKLTSKALIFELIPKLAAEICLELWECYDTIDDDKSQAQLLKQQQVFSTISKYCPEKFNQDKTLDIEDEN